MSRRRNEEIQVFSVSFLDLLSCALGGILLLYLALLTQTKNQTEAYAKEIEQMNDRIAVAMQQLADAQQREASADEQLREFRSIQSTLIGFKGDSKNIVFVFDHSGSMADLPGSKDFADYTDLLKNYVRSLPFENFAVVMFGDKISMSTSSPQLVAGTDENREAAIRFIDSFLPDGQCTETLMALETAFGFPQVDTIVLMSDGEPTRPTTPGDYSVLEGVPHEEVHQRVAILNSQKLVTLNTIAMGDYFRNDQLGPFLKRLADENNGAYLGQ